MHSFTEHPHDAKCWRCGKSRSNKVHKYTIRLYPRGARNILCLNEACGKPLRKAKTPAWEFLVGRDSLDFREDWCPHCHTPYQYWRAINEDGKKEELGIRLMDDVVTGREPVSNFRL